MSADYKTLIVKFSDPICMLDRMFYNPTWGAGTLKERIDGYESTRMTPINSHTAVITSEYNMECVKEWLERNTPIAEKIEY
ncbi:hypothetical protein NXW80_14290 [Bacteroides fragilis]|nr:hypothetical protein [Bacteroides fragilis]